MLDLEMYFKFLNHYNNSTIHIFLFLVIHISFPNINWESSTYLTNPTTQSKPVTSLYVCSFYWQCKLILSNEQKVTYPFRKTTSLCVYEICMSDN